eukprot:327254-Rhodomonas_salina.2
MVQSRSVFFVVMCFGTIEAESFKSKGGARGDASDDEDAAGTIADRPSLPRSHFHATLQTKFICQHLSSKGGRPSVAGSQRDGARHPGGRADSKHARADDASVPERVVRLRVEQVRRGASGESVEAESDAGQTRLRGGMTSHDTTHPCLKCRSASCSSGPLRLRARNDLLPCASAAEAPLQP